MEKSELPNFLPRVLLREKFADGAEECKIFGNLIDKEKENLDDHGWPQPRKLVDPEADEESGFEQDTHLDTKLPFTVQSAMQICFVAGQCIN